MLSLADERLVRLYLTCSSCSAQDACLIIRHAPLATRRNAVLALLMQLQQQPHDDVHALRPFRKLLESDALCALFDNVAGYRDGYGRNLLHLACGGASNRFFSHHHYCHNDNSLLLLLLVPMLVRLGVSLFEADALGRLPVDCIRPSCIALYSCVVTHMRRAWERERALLRPFATCLCALTAALPADLACRILVETALPSTAWSEARLLALL